MFLFCFFKFDSLFISSVYSYQSGYWMILGAFLNVSLRFSSVFASLFLKTNLTVLLMVEHSSVCVKVQLDDRFPVLYILAIVSVQFKTSVSRTPLT